ncbi:MAG TPA: DEAD/DEAH box helicase, partial [Polyangia bacterium]|nr:DEAD/DEAH box helicase [Polyangia bacterium]
MTVSSEPDFADFAALGAPAPLAAALTEREYKQPTPVQARVLDAADADLLVSSQTGSGKTVAFGLVIGKKLLGADEKFEQKDKARALVVAPTRELAAQVQRELGWLFGRTSARIVSFTGGTDLRLDARNLKRGVDIAVGTPGRLVDLIDRKALDLSGIEVVVLDEADEMLDLGFREGLETILKATPDVRRTLLFSATLPPGIRTLARQFQKDAVALDPRSSSKVHEDITHVAHLCADGDRLAALVNVLRLADDDRAIVFCRTRENVSELHTQLTARGFAATAISGDRAQEDRTRALEALRRGKVRVLVATNVAARGLDLPDVGLVVHADLPENAEALTHRSGRTGRAGNKGVNTFIVEMSARRRAERLFRDAHLKLQWTAPPDAAAVTAHDRGNLVAALTDAIGQPQPADMTTLAEQLLGDHDAVAVVAVLMDRALAGRPAGEKLKPVRLEQSSAAGPSRGGAVSAGFVLFEVNLGSADNADAKWILPLVCRRGGITRREVGAIRIARDRTYVEVAGRVAADFAANAAERDPRAPKVVIGPSRDALPGKSAVAPARPGKSQGDRPAPRSATSAKSPPSEGKAARTEHKPVLSEPTAVQNEENETSPPHEDEDT